MSPNSNEISMQIVRNYVLKARDLVVEELLSECKEDSETFDETEGVKLKVRTPDNWFGNNEHIPLKYLKPTSTGSVDDTLKNNPFCSHLSDEQLKELINSGKTKTIEAGTVICSEGEKADKVYLIIEGKVKVYKMDSSGCETELAIIEKGNMFGEMALFDKGMRSACVKTIEKSKFLIFDGDKFLELSLG
jgi:CRP-like cAMP-binding protein